jgi:hypothetical protein
MTTLETLPVKRASEAACVLHAQALLRETFRTIPWSDGS